MADDRAPPAGCCDLLPGGCDRGHGHSRGILREDPQSLEDHEGPNPVIDAPAYQSAVRELEYARGQHPRIADPDPGRRLGFGHRPDIDPEVFHLRGLVPLFSLHDVDGLLPHDAGDLSLPAKQDDPLSYEHLVIPSTDRVEAEKALVIDVGDHHPDLIYVPGEHEPWTSATIEGRERVPGHVGVHRGSELLRFRTPDPARRGLERRGAGCVQQRFQEAD